MEDSQLNKLVTKAKEGDEDAYWSIVCEFYGLILRLSEKNRNRVRAQDALEEQCFKQVRAAIKTYDPSRGSFKKHVEANIYKRLYFYIKRNSERTKEMETVSLVTKEGIEIDVEDVLARVDNEVNVYANEKIALLAKGDPRNLAILKSWTYHDNSDSHTADSLARDFGGKAESQRKYITRFKSQCRTTLASAV